jgi:outer membrane lipoprotein SlyB
MPRILLVLLTTLLLASCSSVEDLAGNNPIIDTQGVNLARYESDLLQCQSYADEVAIAKKGAGIGAVGGSARGVGDGLRERERVVKRCLIGRGYRVLN